MNGTVKTVLIVGGVAVGAFMLIRFMSPTAIAARRPPQQSTGGSFLNMLTTLLPAITTSVGSKSSAGTYNVYPSSDGEQYVVPVGAKAYGEATGTGGFGIAGLDYAI